MRLAGWAGRGRDNKIATAKIKFTCKSNTSIRMGTRGATATASGVVRMWNIGIFYSHVHMVPKKSKKKKKKKY